MTRLNTNMFYNKRFIYFSFFKCHLHDSIEIWKLCLCGAICEAIAQSIYLSLKTLVNGRVAYKEVVDICNSGRRCIRPC